jgi:predicted metal-binding membrane protein
MMVAMMLPATTPVVTIWGRLVASQSRGIRRYARMAVFLGAYLVAWSAIGVVTWAVLRAIEATLPKSAFTSGGVAAATLAIAGVYQLTRLKHACLDHCRSPVTLLAHFRGRGGPFADFRIGFLHGGYCVGCCAGLMLVLIGVGLMNVPAMVVLTVLIFVEKLAPRGPIVARASGAVFLVAALAVWMWRPV